MKILTCSGKINLKGTSSVHGWDCTLSSQNPNNAGRTHKLLLLPLISDNYIHMYCVHIYLILCFTYNH